LLLWPIEGDCEGKDGEGQDGEGQDDEGNDGEGKDEGACLLLFALGIEGVMLEAFR
jgi:hypothetical protein